MENFIKGADISSMPEFLQKDAVFLDYEGNRIHPLDLMQQNGINYIRLRIWNEPDLVPEAGGHCNLEEILAFAKMLKEKGFGFFLDFHYSDWWADPGKQVKPKAWENLDFEDLTKALYDFTYHVIATLQKENVCPDMVQIGNEIRSGMVFPEGSIKNWPGLAELINSGIRAVRDLDTERQIQIVIHLDQGGRYYYFKEWFDAAIAHGVTDFDMIGLSYYPFWHGLFHEFKYTMDYLADRYHKPLIVAETAHPWRTVEGGFVGEQQEKIIGFTASEENQKTVLELIMNITAQVKEGMGKGIFYWEPFMLPQKGNGGWAECMGVIGPEGKPLEGLKAFQFQPGSICKDEIIKVYQPKLMEVLLSEKFDLPSTVKVLRWEGTLEERAVYWEDAPFGQIGEYTVNGRIKDCRLPAYIRINILKEYKKEYNYIDNGNFEKGLEGWKLNKSDEFIEAEIRPDFVKPFPAPPENYLYFKSESNFTLEAEYHAEMKESGYYVLSMDYRGDNTTGVEVELFLKTKEKKADLKIYPTDEDWVHYELPAVYVEKGVIGLGILVASPPVFGKLKNVQVIRKSTMLF